MKNPPKESGDNWKHKNVSMRCKTCMYFVPKADSAHLSPQLGRCRRNAPTLAGWPAVFEADWCGEHKIDATKLN